jgi:hypothetical protein
MIMVMDVYKFMHMAQGSIYACVNNKCLKKNNKKTINGYGSAAKRSP